MIELQKVLDKLIKQAIIPALKEKGFKKAGRNFYKDLGEFGLCINIQSSRYNNEQEIEFTLNTGIFFPNLYELFYGLPLPKFPKEYECFNRKRIGKLMKSTDHWYSLNASTDVSKLEKELSEHIIQFIIPYFEQYTSKQDIFRLYENKDVLEAPNDYAFLSGFLILNGMRKEGEALLISHYNSASNEVYRHTLRMYAQKLEVNI